MTYIIYSMGDGAFLANIFNAVAMLMGEDDFVYVAMIGVLLGVILAALQTVANGGKQLTFTGPALAIVIYMALFVPKVDVMVEDVYTMSARPVDNVPIGMAAAGVIISHMGLYITEKFEMAYSMPGMLQTGYGTPLEMLLAVRRVGPGTANSTDQYDNFSVTLANYYKECTMTGVMLGMKSAANMVKQTDAWAALKFPSTTYTTLTHLPGDPSGGKVRSCNNAYAAISAQWPNRLGLWAKNIKSQYPSVSNYETALSASLNNLVKMGLDARQYMQNAWIMNMAYKVRAGDYVPGSFGATAIVTQASEQARVQFAGEASVFARFMRPLMTFVEGFVYAIFPFMAFAIGFGIVGFKLIGRYLMILIWVGTWMPIMSVTNLFLQMSFHNQMDALNNLLVATGSGMSPLSLMGMQTLLHETADYVALAGTLIAATPTLGLVVIYGGAYTMVSMANKITPADSIDQKAMAPDLLTNSSLVNMSPTKQHDQTLGTRSTGYEGTTPSLDLSQVASKNVTSAQTHLQAAREQYTSTVQAGISKMGRHGFSTSELQQLGQNTSFSHGQSQGFGYQVVDEYGNANQMSDSVRQELKGALTAALSGSAGFKIPGTDISVGGSASSSIQLSEAALNEIQESEQLRNAFRDSASQETQDRFQRAIGITMNDSDTQSWESVAQQTMGHQYDLTKSNVLSAQNEYRQAQQFSHSVGTSQSINMLALAQKASQSPEMMGRIENFERNHDEMGNEIRRRADTLIRSGDIGNDDQAYAMAAMGVMQSHLDDSPDAGDALVGLAVASGLVAPGVARDNINPHANQGVAAGMDADDMSTRDRVNAATAGVGGAVSDARYSLQGTEPIARNGQVDPLREQENIKQMYENREVAKEDLATSGGLYQTQLKHNAALLHKRNNGEEAGVHEVNTSASRLDKSSVRAMILNGNSGIDARHETMKAIEKGDLPALQAMSAGKGVAREELPELHDRLVSDYYEAAVNTGKSEAQAQYYAHKTAAAQVTMVEDAMGADNKATYHEISSSMGRGGLAHAAASVDIDPKYAKAVRQEIATNEPNQAFARQLSQDVLGRLDFAAGTGLDSLRQQGVLRDTNYGLNLTEQPGLRTGAERASYGQRPSNQGLHDINNPG